MKKKTIYIPIEWSNRELDSFIFFTNQAIKKKFRIIIGSKRAIFDYIKKKRDKAGIFFYKGGLEKYLCELISKKCNAHVVLDQEIGPINNTNLSFKIPTRFYYNTLPFINGYLCVGRKVFDVAKKTILKRMKGKIYLSGWPRFDLNKPKNRVFYLNEIRLIKKKYQHFNLFCSNFICTNFNQIKLLKNKQGIEHWKNSNAYKEIPQIIKRKKNGFREFNLFRNFLVNYEKNRKLPILIIRPHPNENIDDWKKMLKNFKKIKLEREYDVAPWIHCCNLLLHRGCTTSIQSLISKKKVVFVKIQKKIELEKENISHKISDKIISNPNKLLEKIENKKKLNYLIKNGFLYDNTKVNSSNKIVNQFNLLNKINKEEIQGYEIHQKIIYELKTLIYRLKNIIYPSNFKIKNPDGFKKKYFYKKLKLLKSDFKLIKEVNKNLISIE